MCSPISFLARGSKENKEEGYEAKRESIAVV